MKRIDKHQWMKSRIRDEFFIKAKLEGYKARSAYKLKEIIEKFNLIKKNDCVADLGAAPGAWIQVTEDYTQNIYALDLLNLSLTNFSGKFLKCDIFSKEAENFLNNIAFDVILSDIAPNCCGNSVDDHLAVMDIVFKVVELSLKHLKKNGNLCMKIFDGYLFKNFFQEIKQSFKTVKIFKPKASLNESNEFYLICLEKLE